MRRAGEFGEVRRWEEGILSRAVSTEKRGRSTGFWDNFGWELECGQRVGGGNVGKGAVLIRVYEKENRICRPQDGDGRGESGRGMAMEMKEFGGRSDVGSDSAG